MASSTFRKYFPYLAAIVTGFAVIASSALVAWIAGSRISDAVYREKARQGTLLLEQLATASVLPLVSDDVLTIKALLREPPSADGFLYSAISDSGLTVRAHTDPAKVGSHLEAAADRGNKAISEEIVQNPAGGKILKLTRTVRFRDSVVGYAQSGYSLERLRGASETGGLTLILLTAIPALLIAAGGGALTYRLACGDSSVPSGKGSSDPAIPPAAEREGSGASDEPTRTPVTVLCASVKGFKSFADETSPGNLVKHLREYLSIVADGIQAYGGTVERNDEDSVTGVFGTPAYPADHTRRAVRAALSIRKSLADASERGNQLAAAVAMGISTGVVLSGQVSSGKGQESFYVGETFRAAASLNKEAKDGEILVAKDVYQAVLAFVSVEPLPPAPGAEGKGAWERFRLLRIEERKSRA